MEFKNLSNKLKENKLISLFAILGILSFVSYLANYFIYYFSEFMLFFHSPCLFSALLFTLNVIPAFLLGLLPYFNNYGSYGSMTFLSSLAFATGCLFIYLFIGLLFKELYRRNKIIFWIATVLFLLFLVGLLYYGISMACFFKISSGGKGW